MLVLTRADVRELIRTEDVIAAVEAAHAALASRNARQTVEAATPFPDGHGMLLPMAAAIGAPAVVGVKVFAEAPGNAARGLRRQHSTITLVDPQTGQCLALMDGIEITLHRTAAATAVATRLLARPDVRTLGLVGAGAQARTHLAALRTVRDFERVTVWSRTRATAERFAAEQRGCGIPIDVLDSAEAVVRSADVLCTLTPSRDPLVRGAWLRPGMHVNAVGAPPRPDHREIDTEGMRRSLVVVDDRASALNRSGEICVPIGEGAFDATHIHADLGELVIGERPGRTDDDEITLFNSLGLALQDMAAAHRVLALATAAGAGIPVALSD